MLLEVVSTESAIRAAVAPLQKGSGLRTNLCVSSSKSAFTESVIGFESPELLRNWGD